MTTARPMAMPRATAMPWTEKVMREPPPGLSAARPSPPPSASGGGERLRAAGRRSCVGHGHGGLHVHRHDARNALFLHGHADQLLGHLHRDLVVADEEE